MEMEALMETEVAELKGFADKALWIQEKIDVSDSSRLILKARTYS
jgi:hypothetical protein